MSESKHEISSQIVNSALLLSKENDNQMCAVSVKDDVVQCYAIHSSRTILSHACMNMIDETARLENLSKKRLNHDKESCFSSPNYLMTGCEVYGLKFVSLY